MIQLWKEARRADGAWGLSREKAAAAAVATAAVEKEETVARLRMALVMLDWEQVELASVVVGATTIRFPSYQTKRGYRHCQPPGLQDSKPHQSSLRSHLDLRDQDPHRLPRRLRPPLRRPELRRTVGSG